MLSVDPGAKGWIAVVSYRGVHAVRPVPTEKVTVKRNRKVVSEKTGKKVTRKVDSNVTHLNYQSMVYYLKYFKAVMRRRNCESYGLVYETVNTFHRAGQSINTTIKQHINIQAWPIACACLRIPVYEVGTDWKKRMGLDKDKEKSIKLLGDLCPGLDCGGSDDLAESCLLGYEFLQGLNQ